MCTILIDSFQVLQNYYWNKRNYTAVTLGKANAMTVVPKLDGFVAVPTIMLPMFLLLLTFSCFPSFQRNTHASLTGAGSGLCADFSGLPWIRLCESPVVRCIAAPAAQLIFCSSQAPCPPVAGQKARAISSASV